MRKPLRACAAASLIAAFPIAAHAADAVTPPTPNSVINPIGARLALEPVPVVDGINANGERVSGANTTEAPAAPASAAAPAVDLDRAVRRESRRTQRKVANNEQRLQTIAPRTTVDRTSEMPDDPVSPAISPPDRGTTRY